MKKTFKLTHPKIKFARLVDGVRSDVKKYLARERKKELPEGFDVWDFDCRVGLTAEQAKIVTVPELGAAIDAAQAQQPESLYIEILAKPSHRTENLTPKNND